MSTITLDAPLQSDLLAIKHTQQAQELYSNHAFAKGGVGQFVATGARGGIQRLPQTVKARAHSGRSQASMSCSPAAPEQLQAEALASFSGVSSVNAHLVAQASTAACKEWEQNVRHPHDFMAASRTARRWDVPKASKWAAVSFYENDPKEVARHLEMMNYTEATHAQGKLIEREVERTKHQDWSAQQRETFRRQRLEQAARYARSGMRPRSAYTDLGATAAVSELLQHQEGRSPQRSRQSPSRSASSIACTPRAGAFAASMTGSSFGSSQAIQKDIVRASFSIPSLQRPMTAGPGNAWRSMTASLANSPRPGSGTGMHGRASCGSGSMSSASSCGGGASVLGTSIPAVSSIPLPKPTYTRVYARMAAEQSESPALKASAELNRRALEARERERSVANAQVAELDQFEAQLRAQQRQKARAGGMAYDDDV